MFGWVLNTTLNVKLEDTYFSLAKFRFELAAFITLALQTQRVIA